MLDFVQQLFENDVISEQMKSEIESAWQNKIQENREQVSNELREEFARKYEHDKSSMVEAVDKMLEERLSAELGEFAEDRQGLIEARAKYAKKMKHDSKAMESFVMSQLKNELTELSEDRQKVFDNINKLEGFIVDQLAKEIAEFQKDKQDLAETKVRLVKESKQKFAEIKQNFVEKSSQAVKETVKKGLTSEITQLKEDIEEARRNDFGRRIFESFASEYATSYLNEKSETSKLLQVVKQKEQQLEEAAQIVAEAKKEVENREQEIKKINESVQREQTLNELLGPLNREKKAIMSELLESVQTNKLQNAFDKYLPAVMDGGTPGKKALTEGKEITGDKAQAQTNSGEKKTAEIFDIRRLAGL
jgi:hypothetical protein